MSNNDDSGVIKIDESDKDEDASLYSEASNEGGDGEGERRGLRGGNLVKLVHGRGWGESQRGMVAIVAAEVGSRTWSRGLYRLSIYLALRRLCQIAGLGRQIDVSQLLQCASLNAGSPLVCRDREVEATWCS